jgi:hypothetical protein
MSYAAATPGIPAGVVRPALRGIVGRVVLVVTVVPEEFFGVVVGVGAGLAAVEVGWWDPFADPQPRFADTLVG